MQGTSTPDSEIVPTSNKLSANLSPQHDFSSKINDVDSALKSRYQADKAAKMKWADVVKVMTKYEMDAPHRRPDAETVVRYVQQLKVYEAGQELSAEEEEAADVWDNYNYQIRQVEQQPEIARWLDKQNHYPTFSESIQKLRDAYEKKNMKKKLDKEATKAARVELQAVIDAYLESLETYNETFTSVANVKEYIAVVKDVAEIAAISQGRTDG